ncbi:hypothetical protein PBI_SPORTO_15 [Arthrobacter phage Sporto]|nr:hypothetical protein PBI_SPORTO_15 [Arthrobacter phage Sporto]
MARFYGEIGYADSVETGPGIYEDVVEEHLYFGDVLRATRDQSLGDKVNPDIGVSGNSISIVGDEKALNEFHAMRYVKWAGTRWLISEYEVQHPRLILRLGGKYNGPTPPAPDAT